MTKYDYLTQLKQYLQPLPVKERNAAMKYYEKYFDDAGPENEHYVILNLGSPKQLADKILKKNRHTLSGMMNETKNNMKKAQSQLNEEQKKKSYIITILMSPILVLAVVLFVLALIAFALLVASALVFVAAVGVIMICMGVPYITSLISVALVTIGIGLVLLSLPIIFFIPALNLVFYVIKKAVRGTFKFINKQVTGKAAHK